MSDKEIVEDDLNIKEIKVDEPEPVQKKRTRTMSEQALNSLKDARIKAVEANKLKAEEFNKQAKKIRDLEKELEKRNEKTHEPVIKVKEEIEVQKEKPLKFTAPISELVQKEVLPKNKYLQKQEDNLTQMMKILRMN
jgi:hypothetical protein